jgi:signal transduction histidine kinase
MIDDLLDIGRIQGGRMTFTPQYFDLLALTRRIVTRFQLTNQNHHLSVRSDAEYLVVLLDPSRIEQVLTNVIGNAIKYSPHGGTIAIQLQEQNSGEVLLCVQDQGIGIPQAQQVKIFGRFSRAENALQHGIHGSGLGLYVCRELVEQQGGRIWFESVEGKGTTFFITLPLASELDA